MPKINKKYFNCKEGTLIPAMVGGKIKIVNFGTDLNGTYIEYEKVDEDACIYSCD